MKGPRLTELATRLALLATSVVVALLLAEGLVRIVAPQDLEENFSWYQAHPVYRFRHQANLDRMSRWFTRYRLRTNSQGLRGSREIAFDPGNRWRVLVHGDSYTFGNGLDEDSLFVTLAEDMLHQRGIPEAQLVNMGVSAHGSSLEYLYYREEGKRYRPTVVVIAVYLGNDMFDDERDHAFTLDGGQLVQHPYTVPRLKRLTDTALYQFLASRSQLLVFVRLTLSRTGHHGEAEAYDDVERFDELNARNQAVLRAFRKEIEADGARPVMLLLPTPGQVFAERGLTIEKDDFPLAAACREALLDTCRKERLDCIDVLPALARAADDPWKLFLHGEDGKPDFHYNEAGHRVVADALASELERIYRER